MQLTRIPSAGKLRCQVSNHVLGERLGSAQRTVALQSFGGSSARNEDDVGPGPQKVARFADEMNDRRSVCGHGIVQFRARDID